MEASMWIEIFGYIGSALVVISMLMSSVVKLRVINTVGSIVSGIYAIICGAFPLALMNGCLIVINVYNLYKLLHTKTEYDLVIGECDTNVQYFLNRYSTDIVQYFPGFNANDHLDEKAYVVYCDGNPSGVLLGREQDGNLDITIEYTTPKYRDCSIGKYLYKQLSSTNIDSLSFSQSLSNTHIDYMKKMGYIKNDTSFVKAFE